jgi:hypothetical protein
VVFRNEIIVFEVHLLDIYLVNSCIRDSELPKCLTLFLKRQTLVQLQGRPLTASDMATNGLSEMEIAL